MKIISRRWLRGPNLYARRACLLAVIDLEALDEVSSQQRPGFTEALTALLPSLQQHGCSYGEDGGFVRRLCEGTYMAHIVEHVTIELQRLAGSEVSFGKARQLRGKPRQYSVICEYEHEPVAERALETALELVAALAQGAAYELEPALQALRQAYERVAPGPSTRAILDAARARGIPFRRLTPERSLFVLGQGRHLRRIQATITSNTGFIATDIASDKQLTKELLANAGLPVPDGHVAVSAEQAVTALKSIGAPVTVKPLDASQGRGITPHAANEAQVRTAFERARQYSRQVIVERFIEGTDYRVLVVSGEVVAAAQRHAPAVTGDGRASVRELIGRENLNPSRSQGHAGAMTHIPMDEHLKAHIGKSGFTLDSVLPAGQPLVLRSNANLSTGGHAVDASEGLHPDVVLACRRAARCVGLDVAGIDLICADPTRPLHQQRAAIVEVNAAPGIRMHETPAQGTARGAGSAILDALFPPPADGRIPLIAVTGTNGKTTTTLAIAHILEHAGAKAGVATTEGVRIGGQWVQRGDCSGYWSARLVLEDSEVEAAVLEVARGGILKRGLGFDRCDVAVVLNVTADHLGQDGIDSLEQLQKVKGVVADAATRAVVLNADDPGSLQLREHCRASASLWLISAAGANAAIAEHLAAGGTALVRRGGELVRLAPGIEEVVARLEQLPFTVGGRARFNVENALAAIAATLAQGLPRQIVAAALASFQSDARQNPLRMNLYRCEGALLLMDYAHNAASYRALLEFARSIATGRVIALVAAPGDRRDGDIEDIGRICAEQLDAMLVYEMDDRRGRAPGETAELIRRGAAGACPVKIIADVRAALAQALEQCLPGDLLVYGCASHIEDLGAWRERLQPLLPQELADLGDSLRARSGAAPRPHA